MLQVWEIGLHDPKFHFNLSAVFLMNLLIVTVARIFHAAELTVMANTLGRK